MCHQCPNIPAGDSNQVVQQIQDEFNTGMKRIQHLSSACFMAEDYYRSAGLRYHSTQQRARDPNHFPQQILNQLKEVFETSRVEQYNTIFARWVIVHHDLLSISRIRFKNSVTLDENWHRLHAEFNPALKKLSDDCEDALSNLYKLRIQVDLLLNISLHYNDVDEYGLRFRWCDQDTAFGIPRRVGQEWATYLAWVGSLPETQRAVEEGRMVDDVALEKLFSQEEEIFKD